MKEWTDEEVVAEMMKGSKPMEINGEMVHAASFENLKRVVFDPRFPDAKSEKATELVIAIQKHFDELNSKN